VRRVIGAGRRRVKRLNAFGGAIAIAAVLGLLSGLTYSRNKAAKLEQNCCEYDVSNVHNSPSFTVSSD